MPLLRWAGGKKWLTRYITEYIPKEFNNYHEPFVGSGAIFQHLKSRDMLDNKLIYLSDTNRDLINFYRQVKNKPNELVSYLLTYQNTKEDYYRLRDAIPQDNIERAAIFYYLNRTSFNGLYRVNLLGKYNVPYGNKQYKELFNPNQIVQNSKLLKKVKLSTKDFENTLSNIKKDDFVFIDPPYTVAHNNNGFIKYNKTLFSLDDQFRLKKFADQIDSIRAKYFITNAYHKNIHDIFSTNSCTYEISRFSGISGQKKYRGYVKEYIFTNFEVQNELS